MRGAFRLFVAMVVSALLLAGVLAGVVLMVLKSNATLADESADASEKRLEALIAAAKTSGPEGKVKAGAVLVFDDFDTAGPRRIAGGAAARALWRSFTKRLGVVEEPALAPRPDYILEFRTPILMWPADRARQLERVALLARRLVEAGGRLQAVARGAPSARAVASSLARAGVKAGRFVALGARPEDLGDPAAIPAEDVVCAWIEGSPVLRAQRFQAGTWLDVPVDFSADPFETALELANPKAALIGGRWRGVYKEDPSDPSGTAFDLFFAQDGQKLSGRIDEPDVFSKIPGKRLKPAVEGTVSPDGVVKFVKTYDVKNPPSAPVSYEGRLNVERTRIVGLWSVDGSTGPFTLESTIVPKDQAMTAYVSAKDAERQALEAQAKAAEQKAEAAKQTAEKAASDQAEKVSAAADLRGEWAGKIKGPGGQVPASMDIDKKTGDKTTEGKFTMKGVTLGVQLTMTAPGSVQFRFPSENETFGCAGNLPPANDALTGKCFFNGQPFELALKRSLKR